MDREVIEQKLEFLRRCIQRVAEKCPDNPETLERDPDQFILRISVKFAQRFVCPLSRFAGEGLGGGNGHDR